MFYVNLNRHTKVEYIHNKVYNYKVLDNVFHNKTVVPVVTIDSPKKTHN